MKEQLQQCLSATSSDVQQTVIDETMDKWTEMMFLGLYTHK